MTYEEWKKENWERAHREGDAGSLTGTGVGGHLIVLGAVDLLKPDSRVLCVGVGTGIWIRELASPLRELWALDITALAIQNIHSIVTKLLLDPRELPSDHFDLALSLWVAPHMSDLDLLNQMWHVVRSLKPVTGVFGLHYKEPLDENAVHDNRAGADDEWQVAAAANIVRRRRYMQDMAKFCGGRVDKIVSNCPSDLYQIREIGIHIVKGEPECELA